MSFEAKISCDVGGCLNEKRLSARHPSDAEIEVEQISDNAGDWLIDYENDGHYCPSHAIECANELGLEYA